MFERKIWKDRILRNPNKLKLKDSITEEVKDFEIEEDLTNVEEEGDIVNAGDLNRIEKGIEELFENGGGSVTGDTLPIGTITSYSDDVIPENWLLLNGQTINRLDYNELFTLWGTKYGVGDGTATFNIPDLRDYTIVGKSSSDSNLNSLGKKYGRKTHKLTVDELPKHKIQINYASGTQGGDGTAYLYGTKTGSNTNMQDNFVGDDKEHNNMQPSVAFNYIVKAKQSAGVVATVVDSYNSNSSTDALSAKKGKELKEQLDLLGIEEKIVTDTYTVIKYKDGRMQITQKVKFTNVDKKRLWQNLYITNSPISVPNFPVAFVRLDSCNMNYYTPASSWLMTNDPPSLINAGNFYPCSPESLTIANIQIHVIAHGTWK